MKIIATIGPNSLNKKVLYEIINKGVDTLRINFSHFHEDEFKKILSDSRSIKPDINIMADLCGKKVRVYEKFNSIYKVYPNDIVYFCSSDVYSMLTNYNDETKIIPITVKSETIQRNDIKFISMKDGTMNFDIIDKDKIFLKAISRNNGVIRGGKGCNLPGIDLGENKLNDKDKMDLKWAIDNSINIISQSYVEDSSQIISIYEYIRQVKGNLDNIKVFAKIETNLGLLNYKEILKYSDGIIIARGDLVPECGIKASVEEEFKILNELKNNKTNKDIIIATHILDSMKNGITVTISEVESIYTFINKGVTGFLLAGETSIGRYPNQVIDFLNELIDLYSK